MKILLVISRYSLAGVPLAQIRLADYLAKNHQVTVVCGYDETDSNLIYESKYKFINLGKQRSLKMLPFLFKYLLKNNVDLIFSSEDNTNIVTNLAAIFSWSKAKISSSSRVHPLDKEAYKNYKKIFSKSWFFFKLYKIISKRSNVLTTVSDEQAKIYNDFFKTNRYECVHNIALPSNFNQLKIQEIDKKIKNFEGNIFITACRLDFEKGVHEIINAFSKTKVLKESILIIIGDGPEKTKLINQSEKLGIDKNVLFLGYQTNVYKYLLKANYFVFASRNEGMPNVLIEAMSCGCSVISSNCETGPKELLNNGEFGYLYDVGDEGKLTSLMEMVVSKPIAIHKLKEATKSFSAKSVIERHFSLLGF